MKRRLPIPDPVKDAIRSHLRSAAAKAPEIYASAAEDEDTITGDFGGAFRTGWQAVEVLDPQERRVAWRWRCDYRKLGGRGKGAAERHVGADGVFELRLASGGGDQTKTMLFQAKKDGAGGQKLLEQAIRLSTWREAAFLLDYSDVGFTAVLLDDVIAAKGGKETRDHARPIEEFLGGPYLDCDIGDFDLAYDTQTRRLSWRAESGEKVAVTFGVKHKFRIQVEAAENGGQPKGVDRVIKADELHAFRLQSSAEEILALSSPRHDPDLKNMRRRLMLAYHPDGFPTLADELRQMLENRAKEFNAAFQRILSKKNR